MKRLCDWDKKSGTELINTNDSGDYHILVKPADIERFYDYRMQNVDGTTAYLDIQVLKCFFKGVERVVPLYASTISGEGQSGKQESCDANHPFIVCQ